MYVRSVVSYFSFISVAIAWNGDPGKCNDPTWGSDIMRIELNTNHWTSDSARQKERGVFIWVGDEWDYRTNFSLPSYPILTALSTSFNHTYLSTGPNGARSAPCPTSYTYTKDYDEHSFTNDYTFNSSMSCQGYYDLSRNRKNTQILTAEQFNGSPEDAASTNGQWDSKARFGPKNVAFVMPRHYSQANAVGGVASVNAFSSYSSELFGYVEENSEQVFGLGLNSTILNRMYNSAGIASRTIGLHYGIPAKDGDEDDRSRNGTLILGGYQKGRLQGDFAKPPFPIGKWSLNRKCPWEVSISSLSTSSSSASDTAFSACIELNEPSLVLPSDLIKTLGLSTSSLSSSGLNLTITLSNNLKISIPSDLVSVREMDKDEDKSPILGVPFLTQTYIFADHQTRELSIGLADNGQKVLGWDDGLECVEHPKELGNLGLAPIRSLSSAAGGSSSGTDNKANSAQRLRTGWLWGLACGLVWAMIL